MTFRKCEGQKKNRPEIKFEIFNTADKTIWKMFAKHHYLNNNHNNAANVYLASVNNQIAGFLSVLPQPSKIPFLKRVHRLVILPDYQGAGFGIKFLTEVGKVYLKDKWRFIINTSSPALINALKNKSEWNCHHYGRTGGGNKMSSKEDRKTDKLYISKRITASFELKTS